MSLLRSPNKTTTGGGSQPDLSKISDELVDSQITLRKRKQNFDHDCDCREGMNELRKELSRITQLLEKVVGSQDQTMNLVRESITEVRNEIKEIKLSSGTLAAEQSILKEQITQLDNKIKCGETNIKSLQFELTSLKSDSSAASSSTQMAQSKYTESELIIRELKERNDREKNVIIIGLQEQTSSDINEQRLYDETEVKKIISTHFKDVPSPSKIFRLGKYNPNSKRPLKICFDTPKPAKILLRNKEKLPKEIKLYSDQTPTQQKYLKELKEELARRQQKGESDLIIKYIKNVPTIVHLTPKN